LIEFILPLQAGFFHIYGVRKHLYLKKNSLRIVFIFEHKFNRSDFIRHFFAK